MVNAGKGDINKLRVCIRGKNIGRQGHIGKHDYISAFNPAFQHIGIGIFLMGYKLMTKPGEFLFIFFHQSG